MSKTLPFFISLSIFTLVGFFAFAESASAAQFYLSPASGSVQINNNITVSIRVNTEGLETAVSELYLNYDQSKLEFQNYSNVGSPLITAFNLTSGSGSVHVIQYIPSSGGNPPIPTQGDFLFGQVTFKALAGSGSSVLSFRTSASTKEDRTVVFDFNDTTGIGVVPEVTDGTYSFTSPITPPPPPPPSGGSSTPPSTSTSGSGSTTTTNSEGAEMVNVPNSVGDTTAPTISNIEVSEKTDTSVVVTWTTDEPATSYIDFGETTSYGSGTGDANYTKDHKITIPGGLKASTEYNFRVFSSDQAGNTAYSKNQTFTTKPPVSVQRTYRFIGLAMIIGGISALAVIAFYYFRKKGPHPDNLEPQGPVANLNPPI